MDRIAKSARTPFCPPLTRLAREAQAAAPAQDVRAHLQVCDYCQGVMRTARWVAELDDPLPVAFSEQPGAWPVQQPDFDGAPPLNGERGPSRMSPNHGMKSQRAVAGLFEGKPTSPFRKPSRRGKVVARRGMALPVLLAKFCFSLLLLGGLAVEGAMAWWQVQQFPPPLLGKPPKALTGGPDQATTGPKKGPTAYDSLLEKGLTHERSGEYDAAITAFARALAVWPEGQEAHAGLERATRERDANRLAASRIQEQFEEKLNEGKRLQAEKKADAALQAFDAALALQPNNTDALRLRAEAKRTLDDLQRNAKQIEGDVCVLVLYTNAKRSSVGTADFNKQLTDLAEKHGKKLLEGGIHVLTTKGVRKWSPGLKLSDEEAFDNERVRPLFTAAFQAIAKWTDRARNKRFKTVLVWDTDFDPTGAANPRLAVPAGRELRLCYRFTDNRDNDMREPGNLPWYGLDEDKAKRIASVENLKGFVEYLIDN